jgi:hypothetical protein
MSKGQPHVRCQLHATLPASCSPQCKAAAPAQL